MGYIYKPAYGASLSVKGYLAGLQTAYEHLTSITEHPPRCSRRPSRTFGMRSATHWPPTTRRISAHIGGITHDWSA